MLWAEYIFIIHQYPAKYDISWIHYQDPRTRYYAVVYRNYLPDTDTTNQQELLSLSSIFIYHTEEKRDVQSVHRNVLDKTGRRMEKRKTEEQPVRVIKSRAKQETEGNRTHMDTGIPGGEKETQEG